MHGLAWERVNKRGKQGETIRKHKLLSHDGFIALCAECVCYAVRGVVEKAYRVGFGVIEVQDGHSGEEVDRIWKRCGARTEDTQY